MLDEKKILERIRTMPAEELARIMQEALDEAGIPYEIKSGGIIFNGLPPDVKGQLIKNTIW